MQIEELKGGLASISHSPVCQNTVNNTHNKDGSTFLSCTKIRPEKILNTLQCKNKTGERFHINTTNAILNNTYICVWQNSYQVSNNKPINHLQISVASQSRSHWCTAKQPEGKITKRGQYCLGSLSIHGVSFGIRQRCKVFFCTG